MSILNELKTGFEERRSDQRIDKQHKLSMKIVFSSEAPGLLGKRMDGSTVDVSASGLRINLDRPVKVDSVLDVWVKLDGDKRRYFLTGNVRWCSENGDSYQVGVQLRERTDTISDLQSWKEIF